MTEPRQIAVKVYGRPAPKGSLRVVGRGPNRNVIEDNPDTEAWRALVARAGRAWYRAGLLDAPIVDPVALFVTVTLERPTTVSQRSRPWPHKRSPGHGDADKLARTILDGLQDAKVYADDAQVVELTIVKAYPDTPGVRDRLDRPGAWIRLLTIAAP